MTDSVFPTGGNPAGDGPSQVRQVFEQMISDFVSQNIVNVEMANVIDSNTIQLDTEGFPIYRDQSHFHVLFGEQLIPGNRVVVVSVGGPRGKVFVFGEWVIRNERGPDLTAAALLETSHKYHVVTGTTQIESFRERASGQIMYLTFEDAVTLKHGALLELPGSIDHTTTAGDTLQFLSLGNKWREIGRNPDSYFHRKGIIMFSGLLSEIEPGWGLCDGTNGTPNLLNSFIKCIPNSITNPGTTGGSATHLHATHATHSNHSNHANHAGHSVHATHGAHSAHSNHVFTQPSSHTGQVTGDPDLLLEIFVPGSGTPINVPHPVHGHTIPTLSHSGGAVDAHSSHSAHDAHDAHSAHDAHDAHSAHSAHDAHDSVSNLPPFYELAFIMKLS